MWDTSYYTICLDTPGVTIRGTGSKIYSLLCKNIENVIKSFADLIAPTLFTK
jgi:hypothetical protein